MGKKIPKKAQGNTFLAKKKRTEKGFKGVEEIRISMPDPYLEILTREWNSNQMGEIDGIEEVSTQSIERKRGRRKSEGTEPHARTRACNS